MITALNFKYEKFKFPCGELHIRLDMNSAPGRSGAGIRWDFESTDEIFEFQLLVHTLKEHGIGIHTLVMPYIPFSRQDRVNAYGECFSLKLFSKLLNNMNILNVEVTDPHSIVSSALINNCGIITQADVFIPYLEGKKKFWLVAPDAGAEKKIFELSRLLNPISLCGIVACSKYRDTKTGNVLGVTVHINDLCGNDCYIVDDICDGGITFIEIARILKLKNAGKIILMVSHGFFTQGLDVFRGLIDEVYTKDGRVK